MSVTRRAALSRSLAMAAGAAAFLNARPSRAAVFKAALGFSRSRPGSKGDR